MRWPRRWQASGRRRRRCTRRSSPGPARSSGRSRWRGGPRIKRSVTHATLPGERRRRRRARHHSRTRSRRFRRRRKAESAGRLRSGARCQVRRWQVRRWQGRWCSITGRQPTPGPASGRQLRSAAGGTGEFALSRARRFRRTVPVLRQDGDRRLRTGLPVRAGRARPGRRRSRHCRGRPVRRSGVCRISIRLLPEGPRSTSSSGTDRRRSIRRATPGADARMKDVATCSCLHAADRSCARPGLLSMELDALRIGELRP